MKRVLMILFIIAVILFSAGCGMENTAREAAIQYLELYRTKDDVVMDELHEFVNNEDLTEAQKEKYYEILKKEYSTLMYEIEHEQYDGNVAYITFKVTVVDLYKAQKEANKYYEEHKDEFNDENGAYDAVLFLNYKLNQMKNMLDTKEYEIELKVIKNNNDWDVSQLSNDDLKKIHGVYEYEE